MISAESLVTLDNLISRTTEIIADIRNIIVTMDYIEKLFSNAVEGRPPRNIELQCVLDAMRYYTTKFRSLVRSWVDLCETLKTLRTNVSLTRQDFYEDFADAT